MYYIYAKGEICYVRYYQNEKWRESYIRGEYSA